MRRLVARIPLAAICLVLAAVAAPAAAWADCPKTSLADIEDEVMCPVCGTPLELATEAPQAERERVFIQRQLRRCRSKEEVKRALAAQFGEEVLAVPEDDGFDVVAYVLPAVAILAGAGLLAFAAVRWRRAGSGRDALAGEGHPGAPDVPAGRRLESDLDRYDL